MTQFYGSQKTLEEIQDSPEFQVLQAADEVLANSVLLWLKMANQEASRSTPCCARQRLGYDYHSGCITCKSCFSRLTRPHSKEEHAWDDFLTQ